MENIIEYQSNINGLWARFILKLIFALSFTFYASVYLLAALSLITGPVVFLILLLLTLGLVTWVIFKDFPLKWRNKVVIDFQEETLKMENGKNNSIGSDILDFDGKQFSFSKIDNYAVKHYDGLIFSSYYFVTIFVNGKEIKLLSFKEADKFTDFNIILSKRMKIKSR